MLNELTERLFHSFSNVIEGCLFIDTNENLLKEEFEKNILVWQVEVVS